VDAFETWTALLAALAAMCWGAMCWRVFRERGCLVPPWRPRRLLEEYCALLDVGRAPRTWPAVCLLAVIAILLLQLSRRLAP
jgi:hypothetical protein